ncbi:MAG: hypothetical protein AAGC93_13890 [Cyanobacteria bacterium P01_F01_bin.53]
MARTFFITFLSTTLSIFLCLVLPAQADTVPAQRLLIGQVTSSPYTSGQAVSKKTGLSTYRRNLERLRSSQSSKTPLQHEPPQHEPLSTTKTQAAQTPASQVPKLSKKAPSKKQRPFFKNRSNQQIVSPAKKERPEQKQQTVQDSQKEKSPQEKSKKSFLNQEFRNNNVQDKSALEGAETSGKIMSAYDMIQAAQQPYGGENETFLARPNLPKPTLPKKPNLPNVTPQDVSERVSQLHTRLRQQPARLNKSVVEPLQGKVTELKEQVGTTAKTTLQQQLKDRGISDKFTDGKAALQQQLENRGIPEKFTGGIVAGQDRIQTTKTGLKTAVINFLKHIEHKAHKAAEQLNQG